MKSTLIFILVIFVQEIFAQHIIHVDKTSAAISIDGVLDEEIWQNAPVGATDFTTMRPVPGQPESQKSIFKMVYDDEAIYIAAAMYEPSRDSIMMEMMARDNIGNTDFIGVMLDTYGNGTLGFEFILSATGVQFDAKVTPNNEDNNWDAVWYSATTVTDEGWFAELSIPYAAIRFPDADKQNWNINFFRKRAINNEMATWREVDLNRDNSWLTDMGRVEGIEDIKPPLRLSFSPYAAAYSIVSRDPNRSPENSVGYSYNVGLDVKYGINDAFTLDMTLVPDFGQVRSDDQQLNLTPVELYFSENRAFFTEGTELFNKGGIFYSRRVGNNQQLLNATKISGRNTKGLGIGFFNAIEAKETYFKKNNFGTDSTEYTAHPLTNYNVIVLDQDLRNNSSITFTNTNVSRSSDVEHDANVTGVRFVLKNKSQSHGIRGNTSISRLLKPNAENTGGYYTDLAFEKLSGPLVYTLYYESTSKDHNPNDLGFLRYVNYQQLGLNMRYRDFNGFGNLNRFNAWFNSSYSRNLVPSRFTQVFTNTGFWMQGKSQWEMELWTVFQPVAFDFYETRTHGRYFREAARTNTGYWIASDPRKKFRIESYGNINAYLDSDQFEKSIGIRNRYRFSDKLSIILDGFISDIENDRGYVNHSGGDIIFGIRNQVVVSNAFGINYTLNNTMAMDLRARHYWSKVGYLDYYLLEQDGRLGQTDYSRFHDQSYTAFTIDLNYRWRFAPGSELILNWKNNISGGHFDADTDYHRLNYGNAIDQLKNLPQNNSISLSVAYFLDYSRDIKKWF